MFIGGTKLQYAWDATSISAFKQCPEFYRLYILEGWQPQAASPHLKFGEFFHTGLQIYHRAKAEGSSHQEALGLALHEVIILSHDWDPDQETRAGKYKNPQTLRQLLVDYLDHYQEDPAETVILENGLPAVELSFQFELDFIPVSAPEQPYVLAGHLDRVVRFNDLLMVSDVKTTTSTISPSYFAQYEPNNQMTIYSLAGKVVMGSPIRGVIIDACQIMLDQENRFVRGFTYRSEDQLEEWLNDLRHVLGEAERCALDEYWPRNDTACSMFGGCRFREVCSKSPQARQRFLEANFTQAPPEARWNPLKPR